MTDFPLPLDGGCFCGALRYRISAAPLFTLACHCTDCRQMTASAYSLGLVVRRDGFAVAADIQPRPLDKRADSGGTSTRFVCPLCATWTHTETSGAPGVTIVRPSSLDQSDWVRPVAQIFTRSAYDWAIMPLPMSYETEFGETEAIEAAFAASDIRPPAPA
ncbi:GFA family protein [Sphingomonas koreensis]|nr:GFA family protein [Sphingomonas koreensis]